MGHSEEAAPDNFAAVVLLHDNARPHTTRRSIHLLQRYSCEVFNLPSYSLDLAPSDFHLFLHLKKLLSGQRFKNDRESEMTATWLFQSQAADVYDPGIQKLVPR